MPKLIQRWICDYAGCGQTYEDQEACIWHERDCKFDPENRFCDTCKWEKWANSELAGNHTCGHPKSEEWNYEEGEIFPFLDSYIDEPGCPHWDSKY